jgi:hypothetical protein
VTGGPLRRGDRFAEGRFAEGRFAEGHFVEGHFVEGHFVDGRSDVVGRLSGSEALAPQARPRPEAACAQGAPSAKARFKETQ